MRGGEKTLAVLGDMFPEAPIHALIALPDRLDASLRRHEIRTSWLQRWVRMNNVQRKAMPVLAAAARSLDARDADAVVCSDAAIIKAIPARADALKICYCYTPIRYVWDLYDEYYRSAGLAGRIGMKLFAGSLRRADRAAADTVTAFIGISDFVSERISRHYERNSVVIYPPVATELMPEPRSPDDFYLVVSELVGYKRVDLAVEACRQLNRRLVVIGDGPMQAKLAAMAGPSIELLGWQDDAVVQDMMARCRAFLFCGTEDFGMTPVEAQAAGRPVIAYRDGGALETVIDGETGIFFDEPTGASLADAIRRFEETDVAANPQAMREHARYFSVERFIDRFRRFYDWSVEIWQQGGPDRLRREMEAIDRHAFLEKK
jgi:glycosyltransferase involved in cell wall biosynthesis